MPEETQTHLLCLNYCSSSFCVLTLALSQNSRFCSHFPLGREVSVFRTAPLVYKQCTKPCCLGRGRHQHAGDGFSEALSSGEIPGGFPSTIFPVLVHAITHTGLYLLPLGYTAPPGLLAQPHRAPAARVAPWGPCPSPRCRAQHRINRVCLR